MKKLSYDTLKEQNYDGYLLQDAPERVLQFREGNFLRAFVDYFIDILNESLYGNILSSMIFSSFPPSSGSIGRKLYDMSNLFILLIIL